MVDLKKYIIQSGKNIYLRHPIPDDLDEFIQKMNSSHDFILPWISVPEKYENFMELLKRVPQKIRDAFFLCRLKDNEITGVIKLNNITFVPERKAFIEYFSVQSFSGRGYMKEGMALAFNYVYRDLKLNILEAAIQPGNFFSVALAQKCGFVKDKTTQKNIKVSGEWCMHEVWTLTKQDWEIWNGELAAG